MKAVYFEELGPPEVLKIGEVPGPTAGPGEIVIDIHAASINGADWKVRRGESQGLLKPAISKFPHILGRDFSGVVSGLEQMSRISGLGMKCLEFVM